MAHKVYFKNLDSIRFIAALMVFLQHAIRPAFDLLPFQHTFLHRVLWRLCDGSTGVSIFFVLSGFLITYLLISEHELGKGVSIRDFYVRRVLRIWPLYFLVIAFSFAVYPMLRSFVGVNTPLCSNVLYHLSFLSNFDVLHTEKTCGGNAAMSQSITWSVSIEEQFYLFWPLIFALLPRRLWLGSLVLVIAGSLFFRLLHHDDPHVLYFHTLSVLLDLGLGGLMAYGIKTSAGLRGLFERSGSAAHLSLFALAFCMMLSIDLFAQFPHGEAIGRLFTAGSFALLISAQALSRTDPPLGLGNWSFANRWGRYTYAIYLLHPIVITLLDALMRVLHLPKNNLFAWGISAVVAFLLTLALSKLSYMWYESRFLALKDRFTTIRTHP